MPVRVVIVPGNGAGSVFAANWCVVAGVPMCFLSVNLIDVRCWAARRREQHRRKVHAAPAVRVHRPQVWMAAAASPQTASDNMRTEVRRGQRGTRGLQLLSARVARIAASFFLAAVIKTQPISLCCATVGPGTCPTPCRRERLCGCPSCAGSWGWGPTRSWSAIRVAPQRRCGWPRPTKSQVGAGGPPKAHHTPHRRCWTSNFGCTGCMCSRNSQALMPNAPPTQPGPPRPGAGVRLHL